MTGPRTVQESNVCTQGRSTYREVCKKMNGREGYLGYQRPYQLRYFHHGVRFPKPGSV
jgi:hypothetical protein